VATDKNANITEAPSAQELIELAKEDKISLAKMKTLIEIHPGIVQSSIKAFDSLIATSQNAGNSQIEAIRSIRETMSGLNESLKILAEKAQSDKTRERIAEIIIEMAKIHSQNFETTRKMNSNNNKTWKNIGKFAIAGLALVATGAAAAVFGRK
jgi:hypothetical protein